MKRFFVRLLAKLVTALATVAVMLRYYSRESEFNRLIMQKYNDKIREPSERGWLTVEMAQEKEMEAVHEAFDQIRSHIVSHLMRNFKTDWRK